MKGKSIIAVVYENAETREAGVAFCESLVQRFRGQVGFDVSWWPFSLLAEAEASSEALKRAGEADYIVFASSSESELTDHVRNWVEHLVLQRGEREGTLVGLPHPAKAQLTAPAKVHFYLRSVAHRAGMDYLTEIPQDIGQPIEDSPEFFSQRAQTVTSVLDEILNQPPKRP
jgi:hypothetical protein